MKKKLIILGMVILMLVTGSYVYIAQYYHADAVALQAMHSDDTVAITNTGYGWYFDGPATEDAFIFYPGGKVEAEAYAPLCRLLAEQGLDVCLVEMPCRLAILQPHKAKQVFTAHHYRNWYIGGHSLGGAASTMFASKNSQLLKGVILLGAYPSKDVRALKTLFIYGSKDHVLNMKAYQKSRHYAPKDAVEHIIAGGNHAQFGSYGVQQGDGTALITPEEQIKETVETILENIDA